MRLQVTVVLEVGHLTDAVSGSSSALGCADALHVQQMQSPVPPQFVLTLFRPLQCTCGLGIGFIGIFQGNPVGQALLALTPLSLLLPVQPSVPPRFLQMTRGTAPHRVADSFLMLRMREGAAQVMLSSIISP